MGFLFRKTALRGIIGMAAKKSGHDLSEWVKGGSPSAPAATPAPAKATLDEERRRLLGSGNTDTLPSI